MIKQAANPAAAVAATKPFWKTFPFWLKTGLWTGGIGAGAKIYHNITRDGGNTLSTIGLGSKDGSIWNVLNPIAGITGSVAKLPAWYVRLFPNSDQGRRSALTTARVASTSLLAAGLVGAYRAARHAAEAKELAEADRPAKDLVSQLSTTFEGGLSSNSKKKKKQDQTKSASITSKKVVSAPAFSYENQLGTVLPVGAMLLTAALTSKAVDNYYDAKRNKTLDAAIGAKENAIKQLLTARARIAKGNASLDEVNKATKGVNSSDIYVKDAALHKEALWGELGQVAGLTSIAVLIASMIGSHEYFKASDENNIKYKAYKKALKEYAKTKAGMSPITVLPTDSDKFFENIDAAQTSKPATARNQPTYEPDYLNKPISVSI